MDSLVQDLRHAGRALRKAPGFTAVALVTLALGIGANTAVFSVVNAVLLRPLPYDHPEAIMALWEKRPAEGQKRGPISVPDFQDWRAMAKSFSNIAVYDGTQLTINGNGDPERVPGARVTPGFFEALSVHPRLGRTFAPEEEQAGHERVAMVTTGFWQRRLGSDPAVVGRSLIVNGAAREIVGVLPAEFRFPMISDCDVIVPIRFTAEQRKWRGIHMYGGIARLKPGVTREQAQSEMDVISAALERQYPDYNRGHAAAVLPLHDELSWQLRPALMVLLGAVTLVALIACANVANLLLARASVRRREMAVRAALGSSRWRLVRQSLAESAMLAVGGATLGTLLAWWGLDVLRVAFFSRIEYFTMAGLRTVSPDWRVLAFTLASIVICTLLFGVAPALANAGADLNQALRSGGRGMAGGERRGLRNALVVAEVAFSIVLLTGAGLLAKSFVRLAHVNPGFQPERVLAAGLTLPNTAYRTTPQAAQFYDALIERVRVLPGVRSAAVTDTLPLTGDDNRTSIKIPGYTPKPGERMRVHPRLVSAGYLETMGIPLEAGRTLTAADDVGTHAVAVISADMARLYWPNGDAVGKHFAVDIENTPSMEIVGIAGAVHNDALNRPVTVDVYLPYRENPFNGPPLSVTLVVRTERSEAALGPAIRAAAASLDRSLPVSAMRTMESYLSDSTAPERFNMALVALFAFLAAALAAAGLYGVLAYLVSRRTEEIGIRVALGARRADVLRLVMAQGIALAGVGAALGVAASFVGAELLSGLLFGVDPHDAGVFGTVPALLIAVAAVASYVPARRAAGVDPMVALRME